MLGRKISPERQANLVRGRLVQNVILGTDKGVMSAKQLGADKRIGMWQPDSQVGMVILQPPPIPKIDHELPLFPVEHKNKEEEAPPVPKIDHEVALLPPPQHSDEEEVEDDSR